MSDDFTRYPRRDFLSQCAALPLVASIATAAEQAESDGSARAANPPAYSTSAGAEIRPELESLLELLDPQVRYRHVPLAEEKNAWPMWKRAGELYVEQPEDEEFQDEIKQTVRGSKARSIRTLVNESSIG